MDSLLLIELIGVPVIFVSGAIFHFLYKYGGKKKLVAVFSPVNESIWEHLKIAFYPALIYSVGQYLIAKDLAPNFFTAEVLGIYSMMAFILVIEWIYPRLLKRNILWIDLFIFFVSILISQTVSYFLVISTDPIELPLAILIILLSLQTLVFTLFSFKPPKQNTFRDSQSGKYGMDY